MLRDMINEKGKSVYRVSKESGLPYTTLNELVMGKKDVDSCSLKTLAALAQYFGVSLDTLYKKMTAPSDEKQAISHSWTDAAKKKYRFPVVAECGGFDIGRIHPLKQKEIIKVYEAVKDDPRVESLILFGSSVTIRCGSKSDIDLAVRLRKEDITADAKNDVSENIQKACGFDADILWMDRIEPETAIERNIMRGVRIK